MKEKLKKKSFWVAALGAVILILQLLGLRFEAPHVNEIIGAVCGLMIILGIITDDTKKHDEETVNENSDADNNETYNERKD